MYIGLPKYKSLLSNLEHAQELESKAGMGKLWDMGKYLFIGVY